MRTGTSKLFRDLKAHVLGLFGTQKIFPSQSVKPVIVNKENSHSIRVP